MALHHGSACVGCRASCWRRLMLRLAAELGDIPYSSSITINLVYDEAKIGQLPEGFGFLVPAVEGRAMLACTFVHRKFLGRTPPRKAVLRAFLGGMKGEALLTESDEALVATVRREMAAILGTKIFSADIEPEHVQVSRWRKAMAQYAVGHRERMKRIAARVAELPGLRLVGNAYDGIGVSDCVRLGRQAARELLGAGAKSSDSTARMASRRVGTAIHPWVARARQDWSPLYLI